MISPCGEVVMPLESANRLTILIKSRSIFTSPQEVSRRTVPLRVWQLSLAWSRCWPMCLSGETSQWQEKSRFPEECSLWVESARNASPLSMKASNSNSHITQYNHSLRQQQRSRRHSSIAKKRCSLLSTANHPRSTYNSIPHSSRQNPSQTLILFS